MSADDPVFNLMSELVIHLKLLAIQLVNHQQVAVGFITAKLRKRLLIRLLGNDGQVSSDVSKPPPDRFANHFRSRTVLLGDGQILLAAFSL